MTVRAHVEVLCDHLAFEQVKAGDARLTLVATIAGELWRRVRAPTDPTSRDLLCDMRRAAAEARKVEYETHTALKALPRDAAAALSATNPRNPRHFGSIGGRSNSV